MLFIVVSCYVLLCIDIYWWLLLQIIVYCYLLLYALVYSYLLLFVDTYCYLLFSTIHCYLVLFVGCLLLYSNNYDYLFTLYRRCNNADQNVICLYIYKRICRFLLLFISVYCFICYYLLLFRFIWIIVIYCCLLLFIATYCCLLLFTVVYLLLFSVICCCLLLFSNNNVYLLNLYSTLIGFIYIYILTMNTPDGRNTFNKNTSQDLFKTPISHRSDQEPMTLPQELYRLQSRPTHEGINVYWKSVYVKRY